MWDNWISYCLGLPAVYEDLPFRDSGAVAMRHRGNRKIFALFLTHQGRPLLNVKAEPMWADVWKASYPDVLPGYHMNKQHWVSIRLDGAMAEDDIRRLLNDSYDLTAPKRKQNT